MSNAKDYYRMRFGEAGFDPTELEPQSIFDARAMESGSGADTKITTIKEDKKGTTETKTVTSADGSKKTLSSFFPTIVPSMEETIAKDLSERDILMNNKKPGPVMGEQGYANADNTMTMPVTSFGEKSASGDAMLSDAGIKLVAEDFRNKRIKSAKRKELNRMREIFDRGIAEKEDDYYEDGSGTGRNYSFFSPKPVQYLNGAKAPYEQGPSEEDESIFNRARFMRSLTDGMDDTANIEKGMITSQRGTTMDDSADVELGMASVNDDGTVDKDKVEEILSEEAIAKDEEEIITSPAAVKSIQQLEDELKALKDNPEGRKAKYLDFLRENGVLKEWRPQLFKALASSAFRLAMGDRFSDAFTYSFGRMQEKADQQAKVEAELEKERIKKSGDNSVEFGKDSKWMNLGTTNNPIKVKMTTRKDGVPVVNYKGKILTFDQLKEAGIVPKEYYTDKEVGEHFNKIVDNFQKDINSLVTSGYFKEGEDIDKHVNILKARSQIMGGLKALEADGVDIGPGMDTDWYNVLTNAATDFIENKTNPNSKLPDKSYINFINDRIVKARINLAGIPENEFETPPEQLEYKDGALVRNGKAFELNPKAWAQMQKDAEQWFDKFAKENPNLKEQLNNVKISRDYMGLAYAAYEEEKEATGDDWMISAQAGYKAGYLPFMYWLRENTPPN